MNRITSSILAALALTSCAHAPRQVANEALPVTTWEAGLRSETKVEVIPLFTGEVQVEREFLLDYENPKLQDRRDEKVWVPVMAYLVRHPRFGDLLIDTGFDSSFAKSGHGNFGGLAFLASFARQNPGTDTVASLRKLGVDPAKLKMIVLSHMHPDHTAGLPELPKSVPLVTGPDAHGSYGGPWYAPASHLDGVEEIRTLAYPSQPGEAIDLLGDGSVLALPTPGHAHGNLSFLIEAKGGPVLLTCDASHTREGLELGVAPGGVESRGDADASLAGLRAFLAAHPEVRVKAGHDARDWDLSRGVQDAL